MMLMRKKGESNWASPAVTAYHEEALLQDLLARSPELLPECDGSEAVAAELLIPDTGRADLVCVSPAGAITLVECKLRSNSEIHRHVIGQVLAYAASLWNLSYEDFDSKFQARHGSSLSDSFQNQADWDEERFRTTVTTNLESGAFSLVLAVDSITAELKRIVTYLNTHTLPSVKILAVELKYTAGHGVEILVPRTYGEETASPASRPEVRHWTEDELMAAMEETCTPQGFKAARRLLDFNPENNVAFYFHKATTTLPAVEIWLGTEKRKDRFVSYGLYPGDSGREAKIAINFDWMRPYNDEPTLQSLLDQLRELPDPAAELLGEVDEQHFRRKPKLPIETALANDRALEMFEAAIMVVLQNGQPPQAE